MTKPIYKPAYRQLIQLLRETRLEKGLTQEQVAAGLGKRQSFIQKCETGERRIDLVDLDEICQQMDVPLEDFVAAYLKRTRSKQ